MNSKTASKKSHRPTSIGFIGFGSFGEMFGRGLSSKYRISFYDPNAENTHPAINKVETIEALLESSEVIILSVPASSLESVASKIAKTRLRNKLIVEVTSTKEASTKLIQELLPDCDQLSIHPLFGPPSVTSLESNLHIIETLSRGPKALAFKQELVQEFKISFIECSASEHDRMMAVRHGYPFFLSKTLLALNFNSTPDDMSIPSEIKLHSLVAIAKQESEALYRTILLSNPHSKNAIDDLIAQMIVERNKLWPENIDKD